MKRFIEQEAKEKAEEIMIKVRWYSSNPVIDCPKHRLVYQCHCGRHNYNAFLEEYFSVCKIRLLGYEHCDVLLW